MNPSIADISPQPSDNIASAPIAPITQFHHNAIRINAQALMCHIDEHAQVGLSIMGVFVELH
jgi:hypothetical protein